MTPEIRARVAHYRRAYFSLCRELGLDEAARHEFNEAWTGKPSTRDFGLLDWKQTIGELQRLNGQDALPGSPRIRHQPAPPDSSDPSDPSDPPDIPSTEWATIAQIEAIESLSARILWRESAAAFVRARILPPLRQMRWDGAWSGLSKSEASHAIIVLRKLARPRLEAAHAS